MLAVHGRQVRTKQGLWSCGVIERAVVHKRETARDGMKVVEHPSDWVERLSGTTGIQSLHVTWKVSIQYSYHISDFGEPTVPNFYL